MSTPPPAPADHAAAPRRRGGWPAWLEPRTSELPGTGTLRLMETFVLVLVGVLLATATINDVVRQTHVNNRLIADLHTWRTYTAHDYRDISTDQVLLGATTEREVVCGNTRPGPPKSRTQICLAIWGPVHSGLRTVHGGWYLPPKSEDEYAIRYGCFGEGAQGLCPR